MYGFCLKLDAGRQKRVGTNPLKKLLKPDVYAAVINQETKLNASKDYTSPFAPTIVRPEFYPSFLRATDVRTIFWKVKNHTEFHNLIRTYVDTDSKLVFEFSDTVTKEQCTRLCELLESYAHFDICLDKYSGKKVLFNICPETDYTEDVPVTPQ